MQVDEESCDNENAPEHRGIQTVEFQSLRMYTFYKTVAESLFLYIILNRFFQS